jgi:hypothetical protein
MAVESCFQRFGGISDRPFADCAIGWRQPISMSPGGFMADKDKTEAWYRNPLHWLALGLITPVIIWSVVQLIGVQTVREMKTSDWASWVQAIGSILAIIGAGAGVRWQIQTTANQQVEQQHRADLQAARRMVALMSFASISVLKYKQLWLDPVRDRQYAAFETIRTVTDRDRFPVPTIADSDFLLRHNAPSLFRYMTEYRAQMSQLIASIEKRERFLESRLDPKVEQLCRMWARLLKPEEVAAQVGPFLHHEAVDSHLSVDTLVREACDEYDATRSNILEELDRVFPGERIETSWPEHGQLVSQIRFQIPGNLIDGYNTSVRYNVTDLRVDCELVIARFRSSPYPQEPLVDRCTGLVLNGGFTGGREFAGVYANNMVKMLLAKRLIWDVPPYTSPFGPLPPARVTIPTPLRRRH